MLGKNILQDLGLFYASEFLIEALEGLRELLVIEADEVMESCVEIMQADGISGRSLLDSPY